MATVSTIGSSGRNYSTPYSWAAAFTSGGWEGDVYADSEINCTGLSTLDFTSQSTSATNYILLTTGSGQSFIDNASVQTNALKYNASNGAAIKQPDYQQGFSITVDYVTISKLQWAIAGPASQPYTDNGLDHVSLSQNIFNISGGNALVVRGGSATNNLIYFTSNVPSTAIAWYYSGPIYVNNTLAICSDLTPSGTAFVAAVSDNSSFTATVYNNATFGFGEFTNNTTVALPGSGNGTDLSSTGPCTGNVKSLTYGSQFVSTVSTAPDFRIKTGSGLIDAGYTASTYIPAAIDIVGTSRPQGSAWDIGCWELIVSGTITNISCLGSTTPLPALVRQTGKPILRSSTSLPALARKTAKSLLTTSTPPGSINRSTAKAMRTTSAPLPSQSGTKLKLVSALTTTTPLAGLVRQTAKAIASASTPVARLLRATAKAFLVTGTAAASISTVKVKLVSVLTTTTPVPTISRQIGKVLGTTSSAAGALVRAVAKTIRTSTTPAPGAARSASRTLQTHTTPVPSESVSRASLVSALISSVPVARLVRLTAKGVAATSAPAATLARGIARAFQVASAAVASCIPFTGQKPFLINPKYLITARSRIRSILSLPRIRTIMAMGSSTMEAFDPYATPEDEVFSVGFSKRLSPGVTVTGATVTVSVYDGTDPDPSAILDGPPQINSVDLTTKDGRFLAANTGVMQKIKGGVTGCVYILRYTATTSVNETLVEDKVVMVACHVPPN